MVRIIKRAPWIALGALGAWLFDASQGPERRRRLRARVEELLHPAPPSEVPADVPIEHAA